MTRRKKSAHGPASVNSLPNVKPFRSSPGKKPGAPREAPPTFPRACPWAQGTRLAAPRPPNPPKPPTAVCHRKKIPRSSARPSNKARAPTPCHPEIEPVDVLVAGERVGVPELVGAAKPAGVPEPIGAPEPVGEAVGVPEFLGAPGVPVVELVGVAVGMEIGAPELVSAPEAAGEPEPVSARSSPSATSSARPSPSRARPPSLPSHESSR